MKRVAAVIVAAVTLALISISGYSEKAMACNCFVPDDPAAAAARSAAVFSGEAIAMKTVKQGGERSIAVLIEVDTAWKGMDQSQAIVYTDLSSCQFEFQMGSSYLLYAYENQGDLRVINCGRSGELQHVLADVNSLGEGKAPGRKVDLSGEFSILRELAPLIAAGAVVAAGAVLLIYYVRRSSRN